MNAVPMPPLPRWERLAAAAARCNLPPPVLRAHIESGKAAIRVAALGRRGLVHVAAEDVDRFARQLAAHPAMTTT